MKTLTTASATLAFITTTAHAGWFGPSDHEINLQNQLSQQHTNTLIIAGILILCVILAFVVGTILGSKVRKTHGKKTDPGEDTKTQVS